MPLSQGNNCNCNNGKNSAHQRQQCHCNVGDNAGSTTSNKGDDARSTAVETCLCINNSNNAIVKRATIAIATTVKMPAHLRQQRQLTGEQQGQ
jgi:hypothetical protein